MRNAQAEHEAKMEILKLKKELYLLKFFTFMTRARPGLAVDVVSSFTSFEFYKFFKLSCQILIFYKYLLSFKSVLF